MISNTTIKASYAGNGLTRQFSIPFEYTSTSQICVALNEEDEETILDSDDFPVKDLIPFFNLLNSKMFGMRI